MDGLVVDRLVKELSAGFDVLQDEYRKLFGHQQALERKLATAREQYNELAKHYGTGQSTTPPLSLSSSPGQSRGDGLAPKTASEILERSSDQQSKNAAAKIKTAIAAADNLKNSLSDPASYGVKIWSGPSADRPEGSSSMMPSISESPLEQDFTIEGKPSQLGCPFASMKKKKQLSSHAASVLSRYNNQNGSTAGSTPISSASRVNGRESLSRRQSRRASFVDPIKAEICGLSDHDTSAAQAEKPPQHKALTEKQIENADVGVCPIRFLDQHSPEEVASYFEKHKNELPRSHEVCILRYQSNEEQIKELDAKYGNIVSMIQGLGQKHKEMLPEEPDGDEEGEDEHHDAVSDEKIRKWASSVSAQAPEADAEAESEERLPHFERPVREIRLGESPSRPWGIQIPAKYLDAIESERSSQPAVPAQVAQAATLPALEEPKQSTDATKPPQRPAGKCPFDHTALKGGMPSMPPPPSKSANKEEPVGPEATARPATTPAERPKQTAITAEDLRAAAHKGSHIVINGPVFMGYSTEDAIKLLKETGFKLG